MHGPPGKRIPASQCFPEFGSSNNDNDSDNDNDSKGYSMSSLPRERYRRQQPIAGGPMVILEVGSLDLIPQLAEILDGPGFDGVFIDSRALRAAMGLADSGVDGDEPEFLAVIGQIRDITLDRRSFAGIYTQSGRAAQKMALQDFGLAVAAHDSVSLFSALSGQLELARGSFGNKTGR
ncbi:hypothetical protein EV182_002543 [Spiromyces aspiralis]|uniref:Uncharacterized protein n=1 Tax=Spiromyces aspiralis TaxID=68401 RepID=A0ACC1HV44_9FUNG|nr:hypothetical protein EV182_002543 [Spiromyces aspiralis]